MHLHRWFGIAAAAFALTVSCGGSGNSDDTQGKMDAPKSAHDGPESIDSPGSNVASALGTTCTTGSDAQGSCPTGFQCLNLQNGTNPWCSKPCTGQSDTSCGTGYTGTGKPACALGVTSGSGGSAESFCNVFCEDDTGSAKGLCGSATCDDMCPGSLACTGVVEEQGGSAIGKACQ